MQNRKVYSHNEPENCVEYAFKKKGLLGKMEDTWNNLGREPSDLKQAVENFCEANGYVFSDTEEQGAQYWQIAFGTMYAMQGFVFHFVRKEGKDWKGIPGNKSTSAYDATVTKDVITQYTDTDDKNKKVIYNNRGSLWIKPSVL